MKRKILSVRKNKKKLLFMLILAAIVFILIGVFVIAVLSKDNKKMLYDYMESFFSQIKLGKFRYISSFKSTLLTNLLSTFIVWILGVSLIGIPIILIYFFIKAITIGMSLGSIIYFYKIKGIFISIIYIIPSIINLGIFIILCYNSIKMSKYLYRILFLKEKNNRMIIKKYVYVLIILMLFMIISSIIEAFVIPNIIRLFL